MFRNLLLTWVLILILLCYNILKLRTHVKDMNPSKKNVKDVNMFTVKNQNV
jgi:hypothetical protein